MPRPTPAQLIRQAGEKRGVAALRNIPPVVIAASMIDGFDPQRTDTLLHSSVKLTPAVHPLLDAVLTESGATRRGSRTYSVSVNKDADPSVLLAALAAIPGNLCYPESYVPMSARAGGFRYLNRYSAARTLETQLRGLPLPLRGFDPAKLYEMHPYGTYGAPDPEANVAVVVSVQAAQVYFRICTDGLRIPVSPEDLGGTDLDLLTPGLRRDAVELAPHEALYLMEEARRAKFSVVDTSPSGGELRALRALLASSVSVHPVAGAPAEAVIVAGSEVSPRKNLPKLDASRTTSVARNTAGKAVAAVAGVRDKAPVVIDPRVADVGAMALAEPFDETALTAASLSAGGVLPSLRPYQREAVGVHLATAQGYVQASAPGLGKTVCSLTAARAKALQLVESAAGAPVTLEAADTPEAPDAVPVPAPSPTPRYRAFVAVPAAIRSQWGREAARWFPEAKVVTLTSKADAELVEDTLVAAGSTPVLVVASYEMTVRNVAMLEKTRWNDLFCDEAVVLKNIGSERSKALWRLRSVSDVAVALTGTPIDKSLDDLGRLVAWVRNEPTMFDGNRLAKRFDMQDADSIKGFRRAIGPILFRRDRSEIADELPAIETEVVLLDPSPAELRLATAARRELKRIYTKLCERLEAAAALDPSDKAYQDAKEALKEARGAMLGGVTLARMAASDPHAVAASDSAGALLLAQDGLVAAATKRLGTKRSQIVELCADLVARDESVLLFTDFSSVAENLIADFRERETPVAGVLGGQSDRERGAAVLAFQDGPPSVLVCTSAAREGLNLQRASVLVHYDLPWNPSAVVQRQARANRIGATGEKLSVLIPIMTGTIEERVASIVVSRATLALTALDTSRGVDARTTELGQALSGLIDAASAAELGKDASLLDLAREILG